MRSWSESEKEKTDTLTRMSARALTHTEQWYGLIWTGVPGNFLHPRVVSSAYIWSGCPKCTVATSHSRRYWRRALWRLQVMIMRLQQSAITVSYENGENFSLADFYRERTWPRMPRLTVWTRQHGKVCPDFRQETWRELCSCWWMWSSKTGRRISHLCQL